MKKNFTTKKIFLIGSVLCIIVCFIFNLSYFFINNSFSNKLENRLISIINPKREFPELNNNNLNLWKKLADESIEEQNKYNNNLIEFYKKSYSDLFYKYNPNAYENPIVEIPQEDIDQIILKAAESDDLQIFTAYYLRTLFIESRINYLTQPDLPLIATDKNVVIWALKEFSAITYFQWVKIWIQELGQNVEKDFNLDFYTFGSYRQFDNKGNSDWTKPHTLRRKMTCDLTNPTIINEDDEDKIKEQLKENNKDLKIDEIEILKSSNNYFAKVKNYNNYYYSSINNEVELKIGSNMQSGIKEVNDCQALTPQPIAKVNKVLEPYIEDVYNFIYFRK
ncbi:hypothetical protein [Spiroplasma endosymbiont of Cantharis nigra]|uniref:hypothetical protein n=1 Tax=Spiroplasma endosymbiont of Cantharis nigra TaxID=3066278 RepID=UPI0030D2A359